MIGLIENLIEDWYIARHERNERASALIQLSKDKKAEKKEGNPNA